jgi:hypothetical protein
MFISEQPIYLGYFMITKDPTHIKKAESILVKDAKLIKVELITDPREHSKQMYPWLRVTYEYKGKKITAKIPSQHGAKKC